MTLSKDVWWRYWLVCWIFASFETVQPKDQEEPPLGTVGPPRAATDDCECETWDRISHNLTVGVANGMFGPCRSNPSCTGTNCVGKIPDPTLGAFNLSFQVFPCLPKVFLRVHLSVPKKGVNWTRDFEESERVAVPGMSFFGHEDGKTNGWVQVNITQASKSDEMVLGVSFWGQYRDASGSKDWSGSLDLIEHQYLPLPSCQNGRPVPERCDGRDEEIGSGSNGSSTDQPSPVEHRCPLDTFNVCDNNEVCRQTGSSSKEWGVCVCLPNFKRDTEGACVSDGGGGFTTLSPSGAPIIKTTTTPDDPGKRSSGHGAAIGGTLGALVILALLAGGFWWWRRRRQTRLRIVRLYDDEEVLMRNDGYQPVSNQDDNNQII